MKTYVTIGTAREEAEKTIHEIERALADLRGSLHNQQHPGSANPVALFTCAERIERAVPTLTRAARIVYDVNQIGRPR